MWQTRCIATAPYLTRCENISFISFSKLLLAYEWRNQLKYFWRHHITIRKLACLQFNQFFCVKANEKCLHGFSTSYCTSISKFPQIRSSWRIWSTIQFVIYKYVRLLEFSYQHFEYETNSTSTILPHKAFYWFWYSLFSKAKYLDMFLCVLRNIAHKNAF